MNKWMNLQIYMKIAMDMGMRMYMSMDIDMKMNMDIGMNINMKWKLIASSLQNLDFDQIIALSLQNQELGCKIQNLRIRPIFCFMASEVWSSEEKWSIHRVNSQEAK